MLTAKEANQKTKPYKKPKTEKELRLELALYNVEEALKNGKYSCVIFQYVVSNDIFKLSRTQKSILKEFKKNGYKVGTSKVIRKRDNWRIFSVWVSWR